MQGNLSNLHVNLVQIESETFHLSDKSLFGIRIRNHFIAQFAPDTHETYWVLNPL
jgi:hypothetical protein